MIDPPAQIEFGDFIRVGLAGSYTSIPIKLIISLELKVSPATVVETVSVLFVPWLLKSKNWPWLPLIKSSGKVKETTPGLPLLICLPLLIWRFRELTEFGPYKVKETVLPLKITAPLPTVLVYPTTNLTWASGDIGSPRTPLALISRLVIETTSVWANMLVDCKKNTMPNNFKKYLISFLILISFNVLQN